MTTFLPLDVSASFPSSPAFLVRSPDPTSHIKRVVEAILKGRHIAVVCGEWLSFPPLPCEMILRVMRNTSNGHFL